MDPINIKRSALREWLYTLLILVIATGISFLFHSLAFTESNIITVYILGALLTSLFTRNYFCCAAGSLASVLLFNFFFTEPRLTFHAYESGYPVTFAIMLIASLITGTLANQASEYAKKSAEAAAIAKNEQLRSDLLRAISHDLRTPLTSISGNAENLLVNDAYIDSDTRKEVLGDIYDDSIWLIQLVENLLSITRIGEGRMKLNLSAQLVEDVFLEATRHLSRKSAGHDLTMEISDDFLLAHMDARLIHQVIINLIDNALKYTPPGSHIRLSAERNGSMIEIRVADDGPGIPDEQKLHVFEMFFTGVNQVADCHRSLGLGLSLCRSIVEAHGGTISVADNEPRGTVFTFTIPASEVQLNE